MSLVDCVLVAGDPETLSRWTHPACSGLLHRLDGPAYVGEGYELWYLDGLMHRAGVHRHRWHRGLVGARGPASRRRPDAGGTGPRQPVVGPRHGGRGLGRPSRAGPALRGRPVRAGRGGAVRVAARRPAGGRSRCCRGPRRRVNSARRLPAGRGNGQVARGAGDRVERVHYWLDDLAALRTVGQRPQRPQRGRPVLAMLFPRILGRPRSRASPRS